jgi:archaellum component FlaC
MLLMAKYDSVVKVLETAVEEIEFELSQKKGMVENLKKRISFNNDRIEFLETQLKGCSLLRSKRSLLNLLIFQYRKCLLVK